MENAKGGQPPPKPFLGIAAAARMAGFSTRHFRRIVEEEHIRMIQIGRKYFILAADFERWQEARKAKLFM